MATPPGEVEISVCVAVYREHSAPNLSTLAGSLDAALGRYRGELVVALNGIDAARASVPPAAVVVDLETNRGVSVGWNRAAAAARGRILVFANDDLVLGPQALERLASALDDHPDAGIVGPVGTLWDVAEGRHVAYLPDVDLPDGSVRPCDVVSGFLMATPAEAFRRIGGFDEALTPCSYEEVDYCTAVRLDLGMQCYAVEGVVFEHEFAISAARPWQRVRFDGRSESLRSIARRNRRHFMAKWAHVEKTRATQQREHDQRA